MAVPPKSLFSISLASDPRKQQRPPLQAATFPVQGRSACHAVARASSAQLPQQLRNGLPSHYRQQTSQIDSDRHILSSFLAANLPKPGAAFSPAGHFSGERSQTSYPVQIHYRASGNKQRHKMRLRRSNTERRSTGFNFEYGYGLVDAATAVARSLGQSRFSGAASDSSSWELKMTNVPQAWTQGYTGQGTVIAVLDTGVDYNHVDLQDNIWVNANETPNNGIDDDGNGFIDDTRGWNFLDQDSNDPMDLDGHGTHVAGSIAALNNNVGVTGVAYHAKIMPVRVIGGDDDNSLTKFDSNIAAGIRYAVDNGADVINISAGSNPGERNMSQTEAALRYAKDHGVVAVMASGNVKRSSNAKRPIQPAFYAAKQLGIAVGAVDQQRIVADFSNPAGNRRLNFVVAPGVSVRSTVINNSYDYYSGTSMATPQVSGIAALMLSANPSLTPAQIGTILTASANRKGVLVKSQFRSEHG